MLEIDAIKVDQPYGSFFLTSIKAQDLLEVIYVKRFQAVIDGNDERFYRIEGLQRRYSESRKKLIAKFVRSEEATFPGTVILSANTPVYLEEDFKSLSVDDDDSDDSATSWRVKKSGDNYKIIIPSKEKLASVIDGQHRLYGFLQALQELREAQSKQRLTYDPAIERALKIDIPCSIFFDLKPEQQAYIFATINFNQKSVDKSLAYELFNVSLSEDPYYWSPDKLAIYLTRRLNSVTDPTIDDYNIKNSTDYSNSPLAGRIKIANQAIIDKDDSEWKISTATVVNGILALFSKNSQADRYTMYDQLGKGDRSALSDDSTPLRLEYLILRDESIYYAVSHYFSVIDKMLWRRLGNDSYFTKTVGIMAIFTLLKRLITEEFPVKRDLSMKYFIERLSGIDRINFETVKSLGEASGIGKTQITNLLLIVTGLITDENQIKGKIPFGYASHMDYYNQFLI